jgi:integrase
MHENQVNPQPESLAFRQKTGNAVDWSSFWHRWAGHDHCRSGRHQDGVIEILIREGKVSIYLKPYAMRHSFITWQLAAKMTPANVAKLVGNSPEIIYKHYVSADKDAELAFEL